MKIVLLLANCTSMYLMQVISIIKQVLKELEVDVEVQDLEQLPYYKGKQDSYMERLIGSIKKSNGVIAITPVHLLSMHGAMQSLFDHLTAYDEVGKPMLAITYSEWMGEEDVAEKMLKLWHILGGIRGGKLCLNNQNLVETIRETIEKSIEDFYRVVKQERVEIPSSERIMYQQYKNGDIKGNQRQIKSFVDIIKENTIETKEMPPEASIDLSTKEQNIKEITELFKHQLGKKGNDDFIGMDTGVYSKPQVNGSKVKNSLTQKLQHLPHYFIAQHNKELDLVVQYIVTDTSENGCIVINEGDCAYVEGVADSPTVELTVTDEVLIDILTKKITYQKAFMLGKLKVRGNFAILSKLDQVFKGM